MSLFGTIIGGVGAIGSAIQGNQTRQKNKGVIGQAYRQNQFQLSERQAGTRQDTNESLNARGVLTAGAQAAPTIQRVTDQSGIFGSQRTHDTGGTQLEQVARSGGGTGVDPFLAGASRNAIGAANTYSGGVNANLTDQFGLEQKDLLDAKSQADRANNDQYYGTIARGLIGGVQAVSNIAQGEQAGHAATAIQGMTGAYGMPVNPTFFSGGPGAGSPPSTQGTLVGDGSQNNYSFHG